MSNNKKVTLDHLTESSSLENDSLNAFPIHFKYFLIILSLFIGTWVSSNIVAVKLVSIFGITLTGGFITFPFTTMLGMIIVEVYGYKNIRQAIWSGVIINIIFMLSLVIVNALPSSPGWALENEFKLILVPSVRIMFASIISLLIAEFANGFLMAKMKLRGNNSNNSLISRMLIACGTSFLLDIILFLSIAFYGTMPAPIFWSLVAVAYAKKIVCQIILLPLAVILIRHFKKIEGIEVSDKATVFNPFNFDNVYSLQIRKEKQIKNSFRVINSEFA